MKKNIIVLVSVLIVTGIFFLFMYIQSKPPQEISGAEFVSTYRDTKNAVLIDVRTPAEYAAGHIDSAVNLNYDSPTFATDIEKFDKDGTYFLYCRSGIRSSNALKLMNDMGYTNTHHLQGGIVGNENAITLVADPVPTP